MSKGIVHRVTYKEAVSFLLPKHYAGRIPSITYAYGWFINDCLKAVCTIGKPANNYLCEGICGKEYSKQVYELNRLCRVEDLEAPLSYFVGAVLRDLKQYNLIVVSYSDTAMHHHGYIYQACNFIYTGMTKKRTVKYTEGNKHSRHYRNEDQKGLRKVRSAKHRYVYFAFMDKRDRKKARNALRYPVEVYPKGVNQTYVLGDYLQPEIIKDVRLENKPLPKLISVKDS